MRSDITRLARVLVCTAGAIAVSTALADAETPITIHSFCKDTGCPGGDEPVGKLLRGPDGTLYGVTFQGGTHNRGVVFALIPGNSGLTFKVLHNFCREADCSDGASPSGTLIIDNDGDLYGAAAAGGAHQNGVVFELIPDATRTTYKYAPLHEFCKDSGCPDGKLPQDGLTYAGADTGAPFDGISPLFGTTSQGGDANVGIAFKLTVISGKTPRRLTRIHSFCSQSPSCADGGGPSSLVIDPNGNLYGTARFGGTAGDGVLFKLVRSHSFDETVLYNFCSQAACADGRTPGAAPTLGSNGRIFGTTLGGGKHDHGTVYRIATTGTEKVLHSFCGGSGCPDGDNPGNAVVLDGKGHIYGSTLLGGANASGTIFEIGSTGFRTVYSFCTAPGCTDGTTPFGLILVGTSTLFGVANGGGAHTHGTVFRLKVQNP